MNDLLEIIKQIRASDCGAWLKDCGSPAGFTCAAGRDKRVELSRLLDQLYKAAETVELPPGASIETDDQDRLDLLTQRIVLLEAHGADMLSALTEARETINSLGNLVESSHKHLVARVNNLERSVKRGK